VSKLRQTDLEQACGRTAIPSRRGCCTALPWPQGWISASGETPIIFRIDAAGNLQGVTPRDAVRSLGIILALGLGADVGFDEFTSAPANKRPIG